MNKIVPKYVATAFAFLLGVCIVLPVLAGDVPTKKELVAEAKDEIKQVDVEQANALRDAGNHLFLDCREPSEYAQGHVPGAINLPRGLLEFKIAERVPNQSARMVVYCKAGGRGCLSTAVLNRMGWKNAVNMDGGWNAWVKAGLPVESSPAKAAAAPAGPLDKKELVAEARSAINQVDVMQANILLDAGKHLFLDCREPSEYAQGHVPGAINIPRGLLEFKIAERVPDQSTRMVVYCKAGGRGCLSTAALKRMGWKNAVNMDGGWNAWVKAGLPVEGSPGKAAAAPAPSATHSAAPSEIQPALAALATEYGLDKGQIGSFDSALRDRLIRFGKVSMDRGRYQEAQTFFWKALLVDPASKQARLHYDQSLIMGLAVQVEQRPGLVGLDSLSPDSKAVEPMEPEVEEGC